MRNVDEKQKFAEKGRMVVETPKSCEEHVFKKARFAWQIKGQATAESSSCGNEEKLCVEEECETDKIKDNNSITENGIENNYELQNAVSINDIDENSSVEVLRSNEVNLCDDSKLNLRAIDSNYLDASGSDLHCYKRKCSPDNCESDCSASKRVKILQDPGLEGHLLNGSSSSERFFNLQAGRASAASNPDFSRAISSILPNFQGLDIPSFIWQKQEMGCAIVDNVFNRTLEEMGLSPDPVVNLNASTRLTLENHSIETAIRNRGLRASNSQAEQHGNLSNMEELQRQATMQDFAHTQSQISLIMNVAQSEPRGNADHIECKTENMTMNCQNGDHEPCDTNTSKYELAQHAAAVNVLNLNKGNIPSATGDHGNSGNLSHNENMDTTKVRGSGDEIPSTDAGSFECVIMEESNSEMVRGTAEKHSEKVLDLAVSTAILNQGLTFESA